MSHTPARAFLALCVAVMVFFVPATSARAQVASMYAAKVAPALVFIRAKRGKAEHVGTGFIISSDERASRILTASHVVFHSAGAQVAISLGENPGQPMAATVLFTGNDQQDIALLEIARPNLPSVEFSTRPARVLDAIAVAGFGESSVLYADLQPRVVPGTVSALPARGVRIEHTAETTAGFSGGPVFLSESGKVVGITQGILRDSNGNAISGANTALSLEMIRPLLEEWQVSVAAFRTPEPKRGRKPAAPVQLASAPSPSPLPSPTPSPSAKATPTPAAAATASPQEVAASEGSQPLRKMRFRIKTGGSTAFLNASIVALGSDHSLTIDVWEDARRHGAAQRVSVSAEGRLQLTGGGPGLSVSQRIVLPLLASGIIPQNQVPRARMSWTLSDDAPGMRSDFRFKIVTMGDGRHVQLAFSGKLGGKDAGAVEGHANYDVKLLAPQNIAVTAARGRIDVTLVEDSFGKRPH